MASRLMGFLLKLVSTPLHFSLVYPDDPTMPEAIKSSDALAFLKEVLRLDALDVVALFEQWSCAPSFDYCLKARSLCPDCTDGFRLTHEACHWKQLNKDTHKAFISNCTRKERDQVEVLTRKVRSDKGKKRKRHDEDGKKENTEQNRESSPKSKHKGAKNQQQAIGAIGTSKIAALYAMQPQYVDMKSFKSNREKHLEGMDSGHKDRTVMRKLLELLRAKITDTVFKFYIHFRNETFEALQLLKDLYKSGIISAAKEAIL
ncbi:hypothetical protein ARMGADRAFT_1031925 [Armillaria gallica]|uniref:Uncharacterized protein n=1 Tax=Armillaria gallica TaxID=47427 RepID=A0A2H3DBT4_ARMGA|nr:hypothetical protein ARMGADRAFT_1031925 [Armillaria gallica]